MPPLHLPAPIQLKSRCLPHVNSTRRLIVSAEGIGPSVVLQHGGNTPHLVVMALNSPPPVVLNDLVFLFRISFSLSPPIVRLQKVYTSRSLSGAESRSSGVTFDFVVVSSASSPHSNCALIRRSKFVEGVCCCNARHADQRVIQCQRFQLLFLFDPQRYMVHQGM